MRVAETQDILCSCGTKAVLAASNEKADSIEIDYACEHCGHNATLAVPLDDLRKAKKSLLPDQVGGDRNHRGAE